MSGHHKPMNICFVSLTTYPDAKDGSAKFQRGIFDELKKRGHNVKLLTGIWNEGFKDPDIIGIKIPKMRYLWIPKFIHEVRKYLRKNDFDIIHGNGSRGSLPLILSGKSYITQIHDLGAFETKFSLGSKYLVKRNVKASSLITVPSDATRWLIQMKIKYGFEKTRNISNAIDPIFKPQLEKAQDLKELSWLEGDVLLYVGRIAFYKGVEDIIRAYNIAKRKLPNLKLIIIGKPTMRMKKKYESWKRKFSDIIFLGKGDFSAEKLAIFYSLADLFVTYSFGSEGFGYTNLEAYACGCRVLCSNLLVYREIMQDKAIYVPPKKPNLLAEEIVKILSTPTTPKDYAMRETERKKFMERFTWENVADNLEHEYLKEIA